MNVREAGRRGGKARSDRMTAAQRQQIGENAAKARWGTIRAQACTLCGKVLGPCKLKVHRSGPELATRRMVHAECYLREGSK
jgi:hypothetical protein